MLCAKTLLCRVVGSSPGSWSRPLASSLQKGFGHRNYVVVTNFDDQLMLKVDGLKNARGERLLSFDEFKQRVVESWESFKTSPIVKMTCQGDEQRTKEAYDRYCLSQYSQYKRQEYGGNPSDMV